MYRISTLVKYLFSVLENIDHFEENKGVFGPACMPFLFGNKLCGAIYWIPLARFSSAYIAPFFMPHSFKSPISDDLMHQSGRQTKVVLLKRFHNWNTRKIYVARTIKVKVHW